MDNWKTATFYLVDALFSLYLSALLLRAIFQWARADFYNPLSQLVVTVTHPLVKWPQRVIPRWRRLDIAALLVAWLISCLHVWVLIELFGNLGLPLLGLLVNSVLNLVVLLLSLYMISIFLQALISWLGPGASQAASVLWSMNEPVLKPLRRVIPPIAGVDISPIFAFLILLFLQKLVPLHPWLR